MSPSLSWIDPDRLRQSWARASTDVGCGQVHLEGEWVHFDPPRVDSQEPGFKPATSTESAASANDSSSYPLDAIESALEVTQPPPTALPELTTFEPMPGPTSTPEQPPPPPRPLTFPANEVTTPLPPESIQRMAPVRGPAPADTQPEPTTEYLSQRPSSSSRSKRPTVSPAAVADLTIEIADHSESGSLGFNALPPAGLNDDAEPQLSHTPLPDYGDEAYVVHRLPKFTAWLEQATLPISYYIADAHGLPIHLVNMNETQAVAAVALTRTLRPLRRLLGSDRVEALSLVLGDNRVTHTVWTDTPLGRMAVGIEAIEPLSTEVMRDIGRALHGVFVGGGSAQ